MSFVKGIGDRIGATYAKMDAMLMLVLAAAISVAKGMAPGLSDELDDVHRHAAQMETAVVGVVIGATLIIGFFVIGSIANALPDDPFVDDTGTTNELGQDKNSTLDRVGQGLLIGGVVIIVLFAGVILRVLRGL